MKKSLLLMLFLALTWCWTAKADELTVYDGTATNGYVPAYMGYFDDFTRSQIVIPASDLEDMAGGTISGLKFYTTNQNVPYTTVSTVDVYVKEATSSSISAFEDKASCTMVYQGTLDIVAEGTGGALSITFSAPFAYNGGNLLIGIENTTDAGYKFIYFYGQTVNGASVGGYNSSSLANVTPTQRNFIPKTTFTYEPASTGCDMPTSITVSAITDNSATISWESEGSAFNLRYKASDDADFTLIENITSSSYNLSSLAGNKNYSVGVQNVCASATSNFKSTSFETANPCAAPKNLVVSNITASSATLSWTAGYQEATWTVKYKKSSATEWTESPVTVPTIDLSSLEGLTQYNVQIINCSEDASSKLEGSFVTGASFPFNEAFNASSIPTGWAQYTGLLSDVMSGTALTSTTYAWAFGSKNGVFDSHARVNIYGNYQKWLVTPAIPMQAGAQLTFDLALTKYSETLQAVEPDEQADDKFVVLASTDNGATWQALRQWDNAGSQDVYDDIACSATGQSIKINLEDYSSGNLMIAFYGESTVSGGDNNLHIDNVSVDLVPDCAKPTGLSASEITKHSAKLSWTENGEAGSWKVAYKVDDESVTEFTEVDATINPYPLTGLLADTTYIVKVRANCGGGSLSDYSAEISVSTPIACIAPLLTNTGITNITAHSADVAWAGDPDAVGFTVSYRTAAYMDGIDEGFESASLPAGWTVEGSGTWTIGTGNDSYYGIDAHSGSYNAKASHIATGNEAYLITPNIDLSGKNGVHINLWYTNESYYGDIDGFGVYYRVNGGEWNEIFATTTDHSSWTNIDEELPAGALAANCQFGFKFTDNYGYGVTLDDVKIGENIPAGDWVDEIVTASPKTITGLAAETKYEVKVKGDCGEDGESLESAIRSFTTDIACFAPTALQVSEIAPHQAKLSWTENGEATAWEIAYKLASATEFGTPIAVTNNPYVLANLDEETAYVVKVRANCGGVDGVSAWSDAINFTTLAGCPIPTDVAAANIKGHTADISWTGYALNEGYVLSYRTAADYDGVSAELSSLPAGWVNGSGTLNADGTATITSGSNWSFGTNCGVFDAHAYFNMYGEKNYWLITPSITIGSSYAFSFDVAYTKYSSSSTNAAPATGGPHKLYVLISTDNKEHWTILREWNNTGSASVLDDISKDGQTVNDISISAYVGQSVNIAFLGVSSTTSYDNNIHIDNVHIGASVPAGAWTEVDNISDANYTLSGLAAETKYEVVVQGLCAGNVVSDSSEIASFTTIESCVAPSALQVSEISNVSAKLSWIENGDAAAWIVAYKLASAEAFTEVDVLPADTPYIFSNLEAGKEYIVKVRANCGNEDGQSEWTTTKSFSTELCAPDDQCLLTFELKDEYGDGWNGNAILVTDVLTGLVLGELANENLNGTSGSDENEVNIKTLSVCNGREIQFSWVKGSYLTETSWVVKDVNGQVLFSGAGTSSMKTGDILYTHTVDCTRKFYLEIGTSGYATFYDEDYAYTMPANLSGHIFNATTGLSDAIYEANQIIPAKEPLVMKAADNVQLPDTFILVEAETDALPSAGNDLIGVNAETYIADAADSLFYVLSLPASNNTDSVGFYWMKPYGAGGFIMPAHKAYLKLLKPTDPTPAPAAFFLFNGENNATWLNSLEGVEGTVKFMHEGNIYILRDSIIYDATGRKVRELK